MAELACHDPEDTLCLGAYCPEWRSNRLCESDNGCQGLAFVFTAHRTPAALARQIGLSVNDAVTRMKVRAVGGLVFLI